MSYLLGTPVCGLYGMFEENFGDPATETPYVRITPSTVAGVLLPFRCPNCKAVLNQFSDAKTREHYHDDREDVARTSKGEKFKYKRDNYWCPSCGWRFNLRLTGMPLSEKAAIFEGAAPSLVEHFQDSDDSKIITRASLQDNEGVSIIGRLFRDYVSGSDLVGSE